MRQAHKVELTLLCLGPGSGLFTEGVGFELK